LFQAFVVPNAGESGRLSVGVGCYIAMRCIRCTGDVIHHWRTSRIDYLAGRAQHVIGVVHSMEAWVGKRLLDRRGCSVGQVFVTADGVRPVMFTVRFSLRVRTFSVEVPGGPSRSYRPFPCDGLRLRQLSGRYSWSGQVVVNGWIAVRIGLGVGCACCCHSMELIVVVRDCDVASVLLGQNIGIGVVGPSDRSLIRDCWRLAAARTNRK